MSQHWLKTTHQGKLVTVMMGWDCPLQGYFMTIFIDNTDDKEDSFLYNNLDLDLAHPKTLDPFIQALDELQIKVPAEMIEDVKRDGELNMGNKVRNWPHHE